MRGNTNSTLWLELLGGVMIVLGAIFAWIAFQISDTNIDPTLNENLMRLHVDVPGLATGFAQKTAGLSGWTAGVGAIIFFGANYLISIFRFILAVAAVFAIGMALWISR